MDLGNGESWKQKQKESNSNQMSTIKQILQLQFRHSIEFENKTADQSFLVPFNSRYQQSSKEKGKASTVIDFNGILKSQHCSTFYCTLRSFKFVNITESSFPKREILRFDLKLDMISKPHCCTIQHKTRWKSSKVAIKSCLITQVTIKCNSRILILLFLISFNPRHHKLQLNCTGNSSNIPQWKWWSINSKKRYNGT